MMKNTKNTRKKTKLELRKERNLEKAKLSARKLQKKVSTTLRWMDIRKIDSDKIILSKAHEKWYVRGIKLTPHNIFIDDEPTQWRWIQDIRKCLNCAPDEMWMETVYAPVNCDRWINDLKGKQAMETDIQCHKLINSNLQKIYDFQRTHREKEFFLMIRNKDEKILAKELDDLFYSWQQAGFSPSYLNERDYYSLIEYYFENSLINDYCFSRGDFSYLNHEMIYDKSSDAYRILDHTRSFEQYGEAIPNIMHDANMIQRSKLAPTAFNVNRDMRSLCVGDKFISSLLVTSLPPRFYLGYLCDYLKNPNIKVFVKISKSSDNLVRMLNKHYQQTMERLEKAHDETERHRLMLDLETQQAYISDVTHKGDRTHNIIIIFQVVADNLKELNDEKKSLKAALSNDQFRVIDGLMLQEELFKLVTPLFIDSGMNSNILDNIGIPLTSESVAGLYPWIFETLNDPKGYLFGEELQNGGKIFLDLFYYLNNHEEAKYSNRVSGNVIVVGRAGSGKTTGMNLLIREQIKNKIPIVWVDPENKNAQLTKLYGGTFIAWGQRGSIINVFDLKPLSTDDDTPNDEAIMWDTDQAIKKVIEDVTILMEFLFPKIEEDAIGMIGPLVYATYANVGIHPDENGKWPSFRGLGVNDMPTFTEFNTVLLKAIRASEARSGREEEVRLLLSLSRKMQRILNEWSIYFNGHTTIDTSKAKNRIVSFGTKSLFQADEKLANALYYLMFQYSWSMCLDDHERSCFVIDEAHTLILKGNTAHLMAQFVRRSRKYRNVMIIGTQEPRDFADAAVLTSGKAIFNNCVYKIVLGLSHDAILDLQKLEGINESESFWISSFGQGQALLIVGDRRRIPIHILATRNELQEIGAMFI